MLLPVPFRMSHARGKAEAAEGVAQKATEECRLARIAAKELSPSFHIYGNGEQHVGAGPVTLLHLSADIKTADY